MTKNIVLPSQTRLFYIENNLVCTTRASGNLFGGGWHFHQEYELVLITKSFGTTLIGDHVSSYLENNLFLTGPNLPHTFICDKNYTISNPECYVLHFKTELFSKHFTDQPEFALLNKLLHKSELGISFTRETGATIRPLFKKLLNTKGIDRIVLILKILDFCSRQKNYALLTSEGFASGYVQPNDEKLQIIITYIENNYQNKIQLDEVASMANMQINAFCRYFKRKTNLSLFNFINKIRVGNACKLLLKKDLSIQEICYQTGYNSSSNFINQFRIRTGMNPKEYRDFFQERLKQE